eukprot:jgi/Ulvmu1/601/UM001_0609.1
MRVRVWPALGSVCTSTSWRWAEGRCIATSAALPAPVPHPLDTRFQWLGEALRLVRESSSSDTPLVKEQLWDVCDSSEWCSIPSKSALGESLKWLKKQRAVKTVRSVETGSRKYPRFGYFVPDAATPEPIQATDEILEKWTKKCRGQDDGHRRALMLSTQATSLAKLVCEAAPDSHPDLKDPWLADQTTPPRCVDTELPDKRAQITQRLQKLVYVAGLARLKHEYRAKLADTALDILSRMEDPASKGLKGQLLRDYSNRVVKLRHEMNNRRKEHRAELQHQVAAEAKYQGWLTKVTSEEGHSLETLKPGARPWWQHIFPETARSAAAHAVAPEAELVEVERVLAAEEAVAQAAWVGSKAEKRAAVMRKAAKSDDERAYAERMIARAQAETARAEQQARQEVERAGGSRAARLNQAQKRLRQEGRAWYHQEVARGELRALEQLRREEKGKGGASTKKPRVSEAAAKRTGLEGVASRKEALHRAKKRWQRTGLSLEEWRDPRREKRLARKWAGRALAT